MICSSLLQKSNIRHGFFTRKSGCSSGIYASLNCGAGSNDQWQNIQKNRQAILSKLSPQAISLCGLYQTHSNIVHYMETPWDDTPPKGDAIVTRQKNVALGILTADCAPVLFADPENEIIGAAHAGWKGAIAGILENTVRMMCRKGANLSQIRAAVGPCIAQENYEVGPEFMAKFANHPHFFTDSPEKGHYLFDLRGFVLDRLAISGLDKVTALAHDTYDDEDNFFSYRRATHRGEKDYGRQISAIVLL